jgi:hypothetical protein
MTTSVEQPGSSEPHSIHVVGIGRTGAVYVEALLRTGEIEDHLVHPGARFAALVVDIGDEDMDIARDYAASFVKRLASRGIPTDRFHFQAIALPAPSATTLEEMTRSLDFLRNKAPGIAMPDLADAAPDAAAAITGGGHVSRAFAKTIYADAYYAGERPLETALTAFAQHVEASSLPSLITVCFSLAGGLGGGIAIDLARHLSNVKLGGKVPVIGVGQLPSTGDPAALQASPGLYATLNDLDGMLDAKKNAAIVAVWGDTYRGPFTGGFFVVNPEQSWQRLTAYTTTGEREIRQRFKQTVTNRFVADSFMRLVVIGNGHDLIKALQPSGLEGSADASGSSRTMTLFDVAKLTHPGVQVLPGEARTKWGSVIGQWIDFTPKYSGLTNGFKTDYAEVFIYASRNMEQEAMRVGFTRMITETYLLDANSTLKVFLHEFFDTLTAYANMVLPGVAKADLAAFCTSQAAYDALPPAAKLNEHAWLVDTGVKLPKASAAAEPMAGTAIWGASCWAAIPTAALRGETLPGVHRKVHPKLTKAAS